MKARIFSEGKGIFITGDEKRVTYYVVICSNLQVAHTNIT